MVRLGCRVTARLRAKMIASLGPSSARQGVVEELVLLGVTCFRINFAHGSPEEWAGYVKLVRGVEEKLGRPIALMGDLVGPSIRLGILEEPVILKPGDKARLLLAWKARGGEEKTIPLPLEQVFEGLEEGDIIVMDDGRVRLRVVDVSAREAVVEALTEARITSRKAIVVKGKDFNLPVLSQRDIENIKFAVQHGFDYIALSYARSAADVEIVEEMIRGFGGGPEVVAKIETRRAVENLRNILSRVRIIVVARGDLGMNYGLEEIPFLQKTIVEEARRRGRHVIVATQLLESMIEKPVPTRAEVTDVAHAVEQGVDALMLTGETSIGRYPVEAVKWLRRIILYTEERTTPPKAKPVGERWRYANGIVSLAESLDAKLLIYTMGGTLPPYVSLSRPRVPVYIGVSDRRVARRLQILWGLTTVPVESSSYEEGLRLLEERLLARGDVSLGDTVVEAYKSGDEKHIVVIKRLLPSPSSPLQA